MIRNNTGFWLHYKAYNTTNNTPELDDAANHTLKLFIDGVLSDPNNTPENIAAGESRIFIDPAESNGKKIITVAGVSSTPNVSISPAPVITDLLISGAAFIAPYTAWDISTNAPKINDVGNHTITIAQDATSGGVISTPAEIDAVNVPGLYKVAVTSVEATGKAVSIIGVSTGNTNIIPTELAPFTVDNAAISDVRFDVDYAETTLTGTAFIPAKADTRKDTPVDDGVGTLAVASASDVRLNVPTDDTVGDYVPADEDSHLLGDSYGSLGTEFTGTKALTSFQLPVDVILEDSEILVFEGCD